MHTYTHTHTRAHIHTHTALYRFYMEHMEECMGGQHPDFAFKLSSYEPRMLEYDAEVEAELASGAIKVCFWSVCVVYQGTSGGLKNLRFALR